MPQSARSLALPVDAHEKVDLKLPEPPTPGRPRLMPVVAVQQADEGGVQNAAYSLPTSELGGSARVYDPSGRQLAADREGILYGVTEEDGDAPLSVLLSH